MANTQITNPEELNQLMTDENDDDFIVIDDNVRFSGYLAEIDYNLKYNGNPVFLFFTENTDDNPETCNGYNVTLSDISQENIRKLKLGKLYRIYGYSYRYKWQDDTEADTTEACEMFEIVEQIV